MMACATDGQSPLPPGMCTFGSVTAACRHVHVRVSHRCRGHVHVRVSHRCLRHVHVRRVSHRCRGHVHRSRSSCRTGWPGAASSTRGREFGCHGVRHVRLLGDGEASTTASADWSTSFAGEAPAIATSGGFCACGLAALERTHGALRRCLLCTLCTLYGTACWRASAVDTPCVVLWEARKRILNNSPPRCAMRMPFSFRKPHGSIPSYRAGLRQHRENR